MFKLREAAEATPRHGLSRDISLGGLLCKTKEPLEVGQTVEVLIPLPEGIDPLSLQAEAVRLIKDETSGNSYLLGLSFQIGEEKVVKSLEKIVAEYSKS